MLQLQGIDVVYRTRDVETTALDNINMAIDEGEFVAVMGPSGCGKSTLLNIVGLLDSPTGGAYVFRGEDVACSRERRLARIRRDHVGFIYQSFNLIDELTVAENIEIALLYGSLPGRERRARVKEVMGKVGITHRAGHFPQQLSGGQQQRVAVARAIVGRPSLILADEPTGNLDSANGEEVMSLLTGLNREGATILMVTHSPAHAQRAQRIINLHDGRVVGEDRRAA